MADESEPSKSLLKSKTVLINLIVALSGLIPGVAETVAENPEVVITLLAAVNIVLRLVTKGKVQLWGSNEAG